jgi:hypothetical protein
MLNKANGRIEYRLHARDLHLVMGQSARGTSSRFRVLIDRQPPGAAHGIGLGQRISPFRRKRDDMPQVDGVWRDKSKGPPTNGLFDLISDRIIFTPSACFFGDSLNLPNWGYSVCLTTAG